MLDEQFKKYISERQQAQHLQEQHLEQIKTQEAQTQLIQEHVKNIQEPNLIEVHIPEHVQEPNLIEVHIPEHVQEFASRESRGLGDTIEKIAEATGIKTVVNTVAKALNKDCGCNKRKEILNEVFPYNQRH